MHLSLTRISLLGIALAVLSLPAHAQEESDYFEPEQPEFDAQYPEAIPFPGLERACARYKEHLEEYQQNTRNLNDLDRTNIKPEPPWVQMENKGKGIPEEMSARRYQRLLKRTNRDRENLLNALERDQREISRYSDLPPEEACAEKEEVVKKKKPKPKPKPGGKRKAVK